ncbi:hypothetical protein PCK1_001055 [Pneumocystis canis]|nr:hypothetical protein PCK1_001055 [Pneumocystis canis]
METPVDHNEAQRFVHPMSPSHWKVPSVSPVSPIPSSIPSSVPFSQKTPLTRPLPYTPIQDFVGCPSSISQTKSVYPIYGSGGNSMNTKYMPTSFVFGYNQTTPYSQLSITQPFSTVSNISSPPLSHATPSFYPNTGYCQTMTLPTNTSNLSTISNHVSNVSTDGSGLSSRSNLSLASVSSTPVKPDLSDSFMISLIEFMNKRGTPITTIPCVGEQPINLAALYIHVMRLGGSHKVTQTNSWPNIAQALGINMVLVPNGVQQLVECYKEYIAPYEEAWTYSQQLLMQQQAFSTKANYELLQEQNNPKKNTDYHATNQTPSHACEHSVSSKLAVQPMTLLATDNSDLSNPQSTGTLTQIALEQVYKPKKRVIETYGGFSGMGISVFFPYVFCGKFSFETALKSLTSIF